ncbi:flagellar biosynthetic protein FliO [Shewanella sp. KJ10-1]|uniref:Flagellar protein n=2 Tax=Shewanella phaeophyticola TaxID=2978345 RepID=A0ABT2P426_9GAMM|nr:flagellar biosynthetic protein FliO [Shewanella sp. KJ10-1]MCT8987217.1 flagellar biosynthetic protein FliO [Shewanella sp. KJ10-1]
MANMISMLSVMAQALTDVDAPSSTTTAVLTRTSEVSNTATLANMVGGLIVVLALIFVLAYIVKRLKLVPSNGGVIKSLAVTPIGQREKVVLIEVNGQQYLLGVTSQQISLIDKLDTQVDVQTSSFASRLKQAKEQQ